MSNNTLAEGILSVLNSMPQNRAEHDELAHSQQRASQLQQYNPLYNNCSSEQTEDSLLSVTTGLKTLWRVNLRDSSNGKKTYVATVLLDKSDKQSVKAVIDAINAANGKGIRDFGDDWNCKKYPLHDGDVEIPSNAKPENYRGKYYLYARSYALPVIIDANGQLLQDSENVYVNLTASQYEEPVAMRFYPYSKLNSGKLNSGIACALKGLMAIRATNCLTGNSALAFANRTFAQFLKQ